MVSFTLMTVCRPGVTGTCSLFKQCDSLLCHRGSSDGKRKRGRRKNSQREGTLELEGQMGGCVSESQSVDFYVKIHEF